MSEIPKMLCPKRSKGTIGGLRVYFSIGRVV